MANNFLSQTSASITSETDIYTVPASTETNGIGMSIANHNTTTDSDAFVTIRVDASGRTSGAEANATIVNKIQIPKGGTYIPIGKAQKLTMEPGDVLKVSSTIAVDVQFSHLDITDDTVAAVVIPAVVGRIRFATVNNQAAGKNLHFDLSSSYRQIDANENFTLEAFVNVHQHHPGIIASSATGNADNNSSRFAFGTGNSPSRFFFKLGSSYNNFDNNHVIPGGKEFVHVAVHRPANSSTFYLAINGEAIDNQSLNSNAIVIDNGTNGLQIGGWTSDNTWNWQGAMQGVRLSVGGTDPYDFTSDFTSPKDAVSDTTNGSGILQPHTGADWSIVVAYDPNDFDNYQESTTGIVTTAVEGTGLVGNTGTTNGPRGLQYYDSSYLRGATAFIRNMTTTGSSNSAMTGWTFTFSNDSDAQILVDQWNACRSAGNRLNSGNGGLGFHMGNQVLISQNITSAGTDGYVDMDSAYRSGTTVTCPFASGSTLSAGRWDFEESNSDINFSDIRTRTMYMSMPVYGFRFLCRDSSGTLRWFGAGGNDDSTLITFGDDQAPSDL